MVNDARADDLTEVIDILRELTDVLIVQMPPGSADAIVDVRVRVLHLMEARKGADDSAT